MEQLAELPSDAIPAELNQRPRNLAADSQQVVTTVERMRMLLRNVETAHSRIDLAGTLNSSLIFLRRECRKRRMRLLQLRRQPDHLAIVVADSGPGFGTDPCSDSGMGLFLAQAAATNHRGRLRIGRSEHLGGAEVMLALPLPDGLQPAAEATTEPTARKRGE